MTFVSPVVGRFRSQDQKGPTQNLTLRSDGGRVGLPTTDGTKMTYYNDLLKSRMDFKTTTAAFNVFCSDSECNGLIREGEPVKKYDGATFTHIKCADGKPKHTAAHKYPNTGLFMGGTDE